MSSRVRSRPYLIRRRDQIAAVESAVRQEIVDTIQAAGPLSAPEISALMGRPADGLYYHLKRLVRVGLLVIKATRRTGRRDEAVYDLAGHPLVLDYPVGSAARGDHPLSRLVRSMLRTADRDFRAAVGSAQARPDGDRRNLWAGRRHAWLSPPDLERVNDLLDQLVSIMTRSRDPAGGELCTLTLVLAPRASRAGRRVSRSSKRTPP
ncbi:MAG: helix-turn-helix transcriptional regulator [Gemmatimonadetes bacterium]|nr:helix-turn-helix transcriptional regulator [Gemmatimonadota bacterium]